MSTAVGSSTSLGVRVLRPSRRKWLGLALIGAMFTATSVWLVSGGYPQGWFGIAFFGPTSLVALWMLVPGVGGLRLGPDGFAAGALGPTLRYSWDDVDNFRVHTVRVRVRGTTYTPRVVAFDLAEGVPVPGSSFRVVIRPEMQIDGQLPDTYGYGVAELAQLMQRYRDHYASAQGPPSTTASVDP
jgi:hypothetical protein